MNSTNTRIVWLSIGTLWTVIAGAPAVADDTELFIGNNLSSNAQPNILLVIDNSGSMGTLVNTQAAYNSAVTYPSTGCSASSVYWRTGVGGPPDCTTTRFFNLAALRCNAAIQAFTSAGYYTDNMAQYDPTNSGSGKRWETIAAAQKNPCRGMPRRPRHSRQRRRHGQSLCAQR